MLASPPRVPEEFWRTDQIQDAFKAWHMGRVIQAYRLHPWHGQPIPQGVVAGWFGLAQTQLSRIENGPPPQDLAKLISWARILMIPSSNLWFSLPCESARDVRGQPSDESRIVSKEVGLDHPDDDVNRRDVLRLIGASSALLAAPQVFGHIDTERVSYGAANPGSLDKNILNEYGKTNTYLWRVHAETKTKKMVLPAVKEQLGVLTDALRQGCGERSRCGLNELAADLFQLCGEVFFDSDRYAEASQCYSLAASAAKEASAFDLWCCALTRHAYLGLYERHFQESISLLDGAARVAAQGDTALTTRHWVASVRAQSLAGLGQLSACQKALDAAEQVENVGAPPHTAGWLRFDGSRLPEERGSCFVHLGRPELAEPALIEALDQNISTRRRGSVLADLATVGTQRDDPEQLVLYADAAIDAARQTNSVGYLGRKLAVLRPQLKPFMSDRHVRTLDREIEMLTTGQPIAKEYGR